MSRQKQLDVEAVEAKIAQLADSQAGGSVQDVPQVAREALDRFQAYKHQPWFRLILQQAAE